MTLDALAGITYDPATIQTVTQKIPVSNPTAITAVPPPPNTSTQIISDNTRRLLNNSPSSKKRVVVDLSNSSPLSQYVTANITTSEHVAAQETVRKNQRRRACNEAYDQQIKAFNAMQQAKLAQIQNSEPSFIDRICAVLPQSSAFFQT